jgi:hypothetical protein
MVAARPWVVRVRRNNGAAAVREDNGMAAVRWRGGDAEGQRCSGGAVETNRKENLTIVALYRLEHRLIRWGGKRTSVQI